MGCDIHGFFEVKIKGQWYSYKDVGFPRNYYLFGKMANVRNYNPATGRNDESPISEPRGLPDDVSVVTKIASDSWGEDGHSHSYIDAKEIKELYEWVKTHRSYEDKLREFYHYFWGYLFGNGWEEFLDRKEDYPNFPKELEDIRIVFWFDN